MNTEEHHQAYPYALEITDRLLLRAINPFQNIRHRRCCCSCLAQTSSSYTRVRPGPGLDYGRDDGLVVLIRGWMAPELLCCSVGLRRWMAAETKCCKEWNGKEMEAH